MATQTFTEILTLLDSLNDMEKLDLITTIADQLRGNQQSFVEDTEEEEPQDKNKPRIYMPRIAQLLAWDALQVGDRLIIEGHEDKAAMLLNKNEVAYDGRKVSVNEWAKAVTGWQSVNIYTVVAVEREGRLLEEIRRDAMIANGMEYPG